MSEVADASRHPDSHLTPCSTTKLQLTFQSPLSGGESTQEVRFFLLPGYGYTARGLKPLSDRTKVIGEPERDRGLDRVQLSRPWEQVQPSEVEPKPLHGH